MWQLFCPLYTVSESTATSSSPPGSRGCATPPPRATPPSSRGWSLGTLGFDLVNLAHQESISPSEEWTVQLFREVRAGDFRSHCEPTCVWWVCVCVCVCGVRISKGIAYQVHSKENHHKGLVLHHCFNYHNNIIIIMYISPHASLLHVVHYWELCIQSMGEYSHTCFRHYRART